MLSFNTAFAESEQINKSNDSTNVTIENDFLINSTALDEYSTVDENACYSVLPNYTDSIQRVTDFSILSSDDVFEHAEEASKEVAIIQAERLALSNGEEMFKHWKNCS